MIIVKHISELQQLVLQARKNNAIIGFVPTMGALHAGHLSLIKKSHVECTITVVSIFVNPTQFNNKADYEKYPRIYDTDIKLLENEKTCDILFMPDEKEMYPVPDHRRFDLGYLEEIMEGAFRPGHFQGVALIVSKLFDAVLPDKAYFGKKDFQQLAVIRKLVELGNYKVEIVPCDIVREPHGLAMSSRNLRLSKEDFNNAQIIFNALSKIPEWIQNKTIDDIKQQIKVMIENVPPFKLEYLELVDTFSLRTVVNIKEHRSITACIAVFCNDVRLIDNIEILL